MPTDSHADYFPSEEIEPYDDVGMDALNLNGSDKNDPTSSGESIDEKTQLTSEEKSSPQNERILYKCTMSEDPYVCVIQNFLDYDEIDALLSLTEGDPLLLSSSSS
eukprot:766915-Hanusia_phi.AAC.9